MKTELIVEFAGPYVSVQDVGRLGYLNFGVPRSGPMDQVSFNILRKALGGHSDFSAIEISVAGVKLRCTRGSVTAGLVGGMFDASIDGEKVMPWSIFVLEKGSTLTVRGGREGSWAYLGFVGRMKSPDWLGSRSTHLYSGLCGRPFKSGDQVAIDESEVVEEIHRELRVAEFSRYIGCVRAVLGPQDAFFSPKSIKDFQESEFTITPNFNRMGMGLGGVSLNINKELTMPSEALVRGAVQVMGGGDPFVLMADHQTTGGYPKIATVVSMDVNPLAQARPGDKLRFVTVQPDEAVDIARKGNVLIGSFYDQLLSH